MKLIITEPKKDPLLMHFRSLFRAYLYYHDIFLMEDCAHTQIEWNSLYGHYDISIYSKKGDKSVNINDTVNFLCNNYQTKIVDYFYDYQSDRREVCGVRLWLFPDKEK